MERQPMRTNIEIDDGLMQEAMEAAGTTTKKATVEAGLRMLIATGSQAGMRQLRGRVKWEGNLDVSRRGRNME
jgi:Arc/MetJ family transcription regulator